MNRIHHNKSLFLLCIIFIMMGCSHQSKPGNRNIASMYQSGNREIKIQHKVFHRNDSTILVYLKFPYDQLLYQKDHSDSYFSANFSFSYKIFKSWQNNQMIDSATFRFADTNYIEKPQYFFDSLVIKVPTDQTYLCHITFKDINRKYTREIFADLRGGIENKNQDYLINDTQHNVRFENWISDNKEYHIHTKNNISGKFFVLYFKHNFPIGTPPFIVLNPKSTRLNPDSVFHLNFTNGTSDVIRFTKEGLYQITKDTSLRIGLGIPRFHDNYPNISKPVHMVGPLRYLTTRKEFRKITESKNLKKAVDEFWLENSGSPARAREMIRKFYTRVEKANELFSTYQPGWQTEMGMIYIIFGTPNVVFKNYNSEAWTYGQPGDLLSIDFNFQNAMGPFAESDFFLINRSPIYKQRWYDAVDLWRR